MMSGNVQQIPNVFSIVCMPVTALISGWERNHYIFSMCRYAQSCAFISVIELPRIPAYYPKPCKSDILQKSSYIIIFL